jgi:hypothetical protein
VKHENAISAIVEQDLRAVDYGGDIDLPKSRFVRFVVHEAELITSEYRSTFF